MWKDFFYYSRSERRVILLLLGLLVVAGASWLVCWKVYKPEFIYVEDSAEIDSFLASVKQRETSYIKSKYAPSDVRKGQDTVLFNFNPNTIDSLQLRKLGLPSFVVRNILRYREKGGTFRTPEAFARIYGLKREQFLLLRPYIQIPSGEETRRDSVYKQGESLKTMPRIEKYPEGTLVELNEADTTQLKRIPGIGSSIAKMIVVYRNRLGGFVRLEQLQEVPLVDSCLNKWFTVQGVPFRKIRVNRDGLDRLRNHPYMDFYKAKAILEYRRKRGDIKGLSRLSLFEEFTEKDLQRLSPYLSFE
ncbi:helix-hairpin-helix domain-containing protein [Phocaeicola sp.]|uniref:helix-hairpin-helix domain-containing protein n=1 Tax=Phocaeicola sp. TaxID=2773926 RepID=UPI003A8D7BDD